MIFILDDVNFFKRGKLSHESEAIVNKLREKMVNKLMKEEKKNNQKIENSDNNLPIIKDKELWRVGVICKKDCFYLTQELLKILEKNGYEWKITSSSYRIKCRRRKPDPEHPNNFSKINPLIVEIKIYGDIDPNYKDEFLVDMHKRAGLVMEFLEFSSSFVSSMQQAGLVVFK